MQQEGGRLTAGCGGHHRIRRLQQDLPRVVEGDGRWREDGGAEETTRGKTARKLGDPRSVPAAFISAHALRLARAQTRTSVALEFVDVGDRALDAGAERGTPTRWTLSCGSRRPPFPRPFSRSPSATGGTALRPPLEFEFQTHASGCNVVLAERARDESRQVFTGPRWVDT